MSLPLTDRLSRLTPRATLVLALVVSAVTLPVAVGCSSDSSGPAEPAVSASSDVSEISPASPVTVDAEGGVFNPAKIYSDTVDGVISVSSIFGAENAGPFEAQAAGGSGFVFNDDGEVVTNAHVITNGEGENRTAADRVFVEFKDGNVVPAEIIGFDPFSDVGLLRVDPDAVDLKPLELADSDEVVVGQPVAVIGSPFGADHSLSTGVVSQTGRSVRSLTDFQIEGAIQTDASINPGNSGGPMLDSGGRVIGISQQIQTGSGASDGVGFGVPVNAIKASVEQLRENGEVSYAFIGVSTQPIYPQLAEKLGIKVERGAIVAEVVEGGPAEAAGVRGGEKEIAFQGGRFTAGGDVIIAADGEPVNRSEDLGRIIGALRPGDTVDLEIIRDGEQITIEVELQERPTALSGR
ncbi:MAG: trypsin-like peptidase domain-containing protein [Solirubrobacterales bacterium]